MKLLHIDSSALGANSVTRELSAAIAGRWRDAFPDIQVEYRDLDALPLPHLTGASLAQADADEAAAAAAALEQFLAADVIVIGAPMYNFSIPSTLKAWIDRIAIAGKSFKYTESGAVGLAGGKKVIVASGRGGIHSDAPTDFQEPYLRQVFGFLGIDDVEFVRAEGVAYSPQHRSEALAAAHRSIKAPTQLRKAA
ncbi:FMN-dependent NADH-azoreductase [Marilutibacter maris]|uniref:FMN dependent NADH:quinone oxidoreductase n=1 Tax=Marilutibacter maris TaxID=1605891 RepID=A0A2U9T4D5_9GAMM|nr:NAD(P)H-dependent oxidoreductase [Lysobacter maris]AWV07371.1 FMN-dependent NADH-azoreductase [Lysobacter maris]